MTNDEQKGLESKSANPVTDSIALKAAAASADSANPVTDESANPVTDNLETKKQTA